MEEKSVQATVGGPGCTSNPNPGKSAPESLPDGNKYLVGRHPKNSRYFRDTDVLCLKTGIAAKYIPVHTCDAVAAGETQFWKMPGKKR